MAFKKGQSGNPKGRRRGSPNKFTMAVKDSLIEALNDGAGAVAFFKKLKNSKSAEDRRCFANICARMLPHEMTGAGGEPLFPDEPDVLQIGRRVAFLLKSAAHKLENENA